MIRAAALGLTTLLGSGAWANVPASYLACEGAEPGDECVKVGPQYGACVLDTLCTPNPDLNANNCLLCEDPCWGQPAGTACTRRDGSGGVCELQDQCTDDPDRSFTECNRCVEGRPAGVDPEEAGCRAVDLYAGLPWLGILLALGVQLRPRRRRG
ncbi:MAG: hypothetical protein KC613_18890 [Myxococcales bacterium]|nr:hypothetical protein [Myxococcales bacterium]